ncbi:glutaredoxin family protein [Catenisphaera adipataccumulans]|jgi:glutaredoxin 3|uniref:Glutaredoxin n=1 Tax=Catenisphaera adipataccumulans TaxID=700500 RepID=A0A7W8FWZ5_9FIRM|nr:glutathione S-transferase N-terminal domain-containing protein [Catenisphaera adipataccumulans]MBB5183821.1 glutaredoxin [Catenisphaera adipataccumulans]
MKLELYYFKGCPFCGLVMDEINQSGRTDIEYHDIHQSRTDYDRLLKDGGIDQVPCLFIDDRPLYESSDIIAWLQAHPQNA